MLLWDMDCSVKRWPGRAIAMPLTLDALDDDGDALADADAHRAERVPAPDPMQLVDRRRDQPCAAGAERMAEGDAATIGIDARVVVGEAQVAHDREPLRGERFIELDD